MMKWIKQIQSIFFCSKKFDRSTFTNSFLCLLTGCTQGYKQNPMKNKKIVNKNAIKPKIETVYPTEMFYNNQILWKNITHPPPGFLTWVHLCMYFIRYFIWLFKWRAKSEKQKQKNESISEISNLFPSLRKNKTFAIFEITTLISKWNIIYLFSYVLSSLYLHLNNFFEIWNRKLVFVERMKL